jgi:copper homeostasis protein
MKPDPSRVLLEVCVGSAADVDAAVSAGADRVELCSGLELGGLTPSIGLVETVLASSSVPVIAMVRPRAGGFLYDRHEFEAMLRDAEQMLAMGASGVAFGILDEHGRVDAIRSRELVERAGGRETVFHRAFDFATDQREALDAVIAIGCTRILTSGGRPTASGGAANLAELIRLAGDRVEVMPGGGVNARNVADIVRATECRQVHMGASGPKNDRSICVDASIELCDRRFMQGSHHRIVMYEAVAATAAALAVIGPTQR